MKKISNSSKVVGALLVVGMLTFVQSSFTRKENGELSQRRILLNGVPLGTSMLLDARGTLMMVEGDLTKASIKKVPIHVYLKRGGYTIREVSSEEVGAANEVEVGKLLRDAKTGDELIVEPLVENQQKSRQVVKLAGYTVYYWFRIPSQKGDGC